MRTLKREEIHANCYRDIEHLREKVVEFIEEYYNKCRLHSALNYSSPDAFERAADTPSQNAATMRYFTPKKNAQSQTNVEAA